MMIGSIFSKQLEPINISGVSSHLYKQVKEIHVIVRTVEIPVINLLGAKHMYLALNLENDVTIISHISDQNGGKKPQITFQTLKSYNIEDSDTYVQVIKLNFKIFLQEIIYFAQVYQNEYMIYQIISKNCQNYCIEMLKMIGVKDCYLQFVQRYSEDNVQSCVFKGILSFPILVGLAIGMTRQAI